MRKDTLMLCLAIAGLCANASVFAQSKRMVSKPKGGVVEENIIGNMTSGETESQ